MSRKQSPTEGHRPTAAPVTQPNPTPASPPPPPPKGIEP